MVVDPDIFFPDLRSGMQIFGDLPIEGFLDIVGPARDLECLNENYFRRVIDAKISLLPTDALKVG